MANKTLNIALDENLIKDIDRVAKQDLASRSEYFKRLALADINRRKRWNELFKAGRAVGNQMGISSETQVYKLLDD